MKQLLWFWLAIPVLAGQTFWFLDGNDQKVTLSQLSRRTPQGLVCCTLWCSRCASCRHIEPDLTRLHQDMNGRVTVVAIDASAYDDAQAIARYGLPVPVLRDPLGGLADRLQIQLTTTTVIFDSQQSLRYFGNFSGARPALGQLLSHQEVTTPVTPLQGCPIRRP